MIYYPLTTLIESGIKDICLISSPEQIFNFSNLLSDGSQFGVNITYEVQPTPTGIPQAFTIAKEHIEDDDVALILGDNIFYGSNVFKKAFEEFQSGGAIFGYEVNDPTRYGVVEFDDAQNAISIEEKPKTPKSNFAIPGLYIFENSVVDIAAGIKPSARGEMEITDVIRHYLNKKELKVYPINRGCVWLDAGTSRSFHESSEYVEVIERRQGIKIGCPEEAALRSGLITKSELMMNMQSIPDCDYKDYLEKVLGK
jgi:glucose-1-phosphate thymidylyltransferase